MLFIGPTTETSSESKKQLKNIHRCSAGDKNCVNDRSVDVIDYDNEHVVCDEDHPFFCDIIDSLNGVNDKLKKSLNFNKFVSDIMPLDVHKQKNKRNYKSLQGNENMKSVQKSNLPNSDGFICAAYGFFPGMNV